MARRGPLVLLLFLPIAIWAAPSAYYGAATPCGWLGKSLRREMAIAIASERNGALVPLIAESRLRQMMGGLRPAYCLKVLLVRLGSVERTPAFRQAEARLSADLKNLASVQEIYLLDHGGYAARLAELDYSSPFPENVIEMVVREPLGMGDAGNEFRVRRDLPHLRWFTARSCSFRSSRGAETGHMRDQGDTVNVDKRPEPVDWKLCTCKKVYTAGQEGLIDVNATPTIINGTLTVPSERSRAMARGSPSFTATK